MLPGRCNRRLDKSSSLSATCKASLTDQVLADAQNLPGLTGTKEVLLRARLKRKMAYIMAYLGSFLMIALIRAKHD